MNYSINLPDDLHKKFQAALILREEDEETVLIEMIKKYISGLFKQPAENVYASDSVILETETGEENKVIRRISLWAKRPEQMNHRILQSFFACTSQKSANKTAMKQYFIEAGCGTAWQFESNLASMCTNDGNAHGKVFEITGINVSLCDDVAQLVWNYRDAFLAHRPAQGAAIAANAASSANADNQKRAFISWFRKLTYNGRPYNPVTISGYSGRIESACQDEVFSEIQRKNLFQIDDYVEFLAVKRQIQNCPGYAAFDAKSHNGFTAALNKYQEFLKGKNR